MEQLLYTFGGVTIQSQGTSDIAAAFDMRGTLTTNVTDGTFDTHRAYARPYHDTIRVGQNR